MSGLKWERSLMGRTSRAEVGPITAYALVGAECVDDLIFESEAPTLDEAESLAEAKLRETYDALREHFDPVPVLRWTQVSDSAHEARFVVDPSSPLTGWVLCAAYNRHYVSYDRRSMERDPHEDPHTVEDHKRAAEAALRALGVSFRVEGA